MTDSPEAEIVAYADGAISSIDARWPEAVERAKQMHEGGLPSVCTMPIIGLVQEREHVLRVLGSDPSEMKVPKSMRADAHEKALPAHVRDAYRRGAYLAGRLRTAHERHAKKLGPAR